MQKSSEVIIATAAVATAQIIGARWIAAPNHPRTAAWYATLQKPSFTPPGPVFGAAWTALDMLLGYSGIACCVPRRRRSGPWRLAR
jgi:benzodiazapine receptor